MHGDGALFGIFKISVLQSKVPLLLLKSLHRMTSRRQTVIPTPTPVNEKAPAEYEASHAT